MPSDYAKRKANGRCPRCGGQPEGGVHCLRCQAALRAKRYHQTTVETGLVCRLSPRPRKFVQVFNPDKGLQVYEVVWP